MSSSSLRVSVVGLGIMGMRHAAVLHRMQSVTLVGGVDPSAARQSAYASRFPGQVCTHWEDLTKLDAVVLATMPSLHTDIACALFAQGVHGLVEKPIALTEAEGRRMEHAATCHRVCLAVGHIERFHPVVNALQTHVHAGVIGNVTSVHTRRRGAFPTRMRSVGILLDSAVHDIDLLHMLIPGEVERVEGKIVSMEEGEIHAAQGTLVFSKGIVGKLDVSWKHPDSMRQLAVLGEKGILWGDLLAKTLVLYPWIKDDFAWQPMTYGKVIPVNLYQDPLRAELEAFVARVHGNSKACVSAAEGVRALCTTLRLADFLQKGHPFASARTTL